MLVRALFEANFICKIYKLIKPLQLDYIFSINQIRWVVSKIATPFKFLRLIDKDFWGQRKNVIMSQECKWFENYLNIVTSVPLSLVIKNQKFILWNQT